MGKRKYIRQILAFGNYFKEFKKTQPKQVLKKIYQVFLYIMTLQVIPKTFLKSIEGVPGLFEIRIEENGNIYRIFCCMDEGNLIILFNAFQKKTQKTPQQEIERAKRIMNEYFKKKEGLQHE
ncbi:type II toxin-antitoxin system RelE/ParE family toxin [Segatella cerevisiae]|nr:type II toxin-antitoxin system RelE/ParE family toxin [Segatella cerevisiae]